HPRAEEHEHRGAE
ncbi:type IV secretion system Vgr family protein, partial [Escherichia coli EC1735]